MEVTTLWAQMQSMQKFMQEMSHSLDHSIPIYLASSEFSPQGGSLEDRGAGDGDKLGGSVLSGSDGGGSDSFCASSRGGDNGLGGTGRGGGSNDDDLSAFFDEIEQLLGDADCA